MKRPLLLSALLLLLGAGAHAQCPDGETQVTMSIATDMYGSETTWTVTGPGGSPVFASGGPYSNHGSPNAYPQTPVNFCVPDGTMLTITVNDAYGDGMCCSYGNGYWTVSVDGTAMATGGSFGNQEVATLVLGTDAGILNGLPAVVAAGNTDIIGSVRNNGTTPITSFTVAYAFNGGDPLSQTFNATIAPGATYDFTHGTPWEATVGNHTLSLTLSDVDGDLVAANNTVSSVVAVATGSVDRTIVLEQFTSSTCGPCASLNVQFAPFLTNMETNQEGSRSAAVKYHMNWPSPGNDPSYNPHGNARRGYYGVTGIPDLYLEGSSLSSYGTAVWNEAMARPAFVDIDASATIDGNTITVNVEFTPFADFTAQHKLHIVVTENSYDYPASTTNQDEFHYVQRRMMPNANGTNFNGVFAGQTYTVEQSYTFGDGNPAQGNYNLWTDMDNLTVVVFLQAHGSKEIRQGQVVTPTFSTGVAAAAGELPFGLMPNPSNGSVALAFDMPESGVAQVEVHDRLGALVHAQGINATIGTQRATLDLQHLSNGLYHVSVTAAGKRGSHKLLLEK
ncbi:MAG: T9SS type A sorting domain-containing protein [Flavobacteriales bacterium]|jgi:hypothetical protein|nr:T9SS type A sorting domain-containing protein [Flavobacteriales bacterium]